VRILYTAGMVLLFCLCSCRTETIQCGLAGLEVYFVRFTDEEVNKPMLFVYKKDNLFDSLVDSVVTFTKQIGTSDTMQFLHHLDGDHDYKLKLPGSNTVYAITGITPGNHYTEKIQTGIVNDMRLYTCTNNTVSYTVNGQQYGQPNVVTGLYNVDYINK